MIWKVLCYLFVGSLGALIALLGLWGLSQLHSVFWTAASTVVILNSDYADHMKFIERGTAGILQKDRATYGPGIALIGMTVAMLGTFVVERAVVWILATIRRRRGAAKQ